MTLTAISILRSFLESQQATHVWNTASTPGASHSPLMQMPGLPWSAHMKKQPAFSINSRMPNNAKTLLTPETFKHPDSRRHSKSTIPGPDVAFLPQIRTTRYWLLSAFPRLPRCRLNPTISVPIHSLMNIAGVLPLQVWQQSELPGMRQSTAKGVARHSAAISLPCGKPCRGSPAGTGHVCQDRTM